MAKLDFMQMTYAYTGATFTVAATSAVAGALLELPVMPTVGWSWLVLVGGPSVYVATDKLLEVLGKKQPRQLTVSNASNQGRKVPINYGNGKVSHTFLNELTIFGKQKQTLSLAAPDEQPQPMMFTVDNRTLTLDEVDYFIRKAYNLQRQRKPGLSRAYWMTKHRPNYERWQYDVNIELLNMAGLIVDRGERRSGRLLGSPAMALNKIKTIV